MICRGYTGYEACGSSLIHNKLGDGGLYLSLPFEFHHYLPIHDADLHSGLYLIGGGRRRISPDQSYPPVEHPGVYHFRWEQGRELPEYQLILLTDGGGEFESEATGVVNLLGPCLLVLFPGVWHRYRPTRASGWTERWISLHGGNVQEWFEEGLLDPRHAVANVCDVDFCESVFDGVLDRIAEEPTGQTLPIRIGAMQLLVLAIEHALRDKAATPTEDFEEENQDEIQYGNNGTGISQDECRYENLTDELVRQAMHLIWTQSHRRMSVDHLVSQLPCTRRTLERRFSTAIGHTILDEINHCRLTRAQRLLTETSLAIKPIAFMSGFSNHERLRVLMLEKEGCSPSEYRLRMTNKDES